MLSAEWHVSFDSEGRAGRCTVISVLFGEFWAGRGGLEGFGCEVAGGGGPEAVAAVEAAAEA